MPRFKVAHIKEQGQDIVIVPLDSAFGHKVTSEQQMIADELQLRSQSAGLTGRVVPVWDSGGGVWGSLLLVIGTVFSGALTFIGFSRISTASFTGKERTYG